MKESQKDIKNYYCKYDFFFTFKKDKISTTEKIWNYSPLLFLIYLFTFNLIVSNTIFKTNNSINNHNAIKNQEFYEINDPLNNNLLLKSIKNTTFISID